MRLALIATILSLGGYTSPASAGDTLTHMSRNTVLDGDPLVIGELSPISEEEAESLAASTATALPQWQRCFQTGSEWLQWSEDGSKLDLKQPWGSPTEAQLWTARCNEGWIVAGGYAYVREAREDADKRVLFFVHDPADRTPVAIGILKAIAVGSDRVTLNEVRAIDPVSGRMLFAVTSTKGGRQYLATAPFTSRAPLVTQK